MKYILELFVITLFLISKVESSLPKCSTCIVYGIGKDGALWGLENNSFCKISSKCKPNVNIITKKKSTKKSTKTKTVKKSTNKKTSKKSNNKKTTTTVTTPPTPVPHQTDERGNFICNGCIVTATGGDNSLWGWEEEKSCIISLTNCKGKLKEEKKKKIVKIVKQMLTLKRMLLIITFVMDVKLLPLVQIMPIGVMKMKHHVSLIIPSVN